MDIYVLDAGFNIIDVIDDYEYLLWDMAFYKHGFFEVKVPITRLKSITDGRYIYRFDSAYTGRIGNIVVDGQFAVASGGFLETLLDFRVDITGKEYTGCVESAMFGLLRDNVTQARAIQGFRLGTDKNRGIQGTFSAFGKSLAQYLYELAESYNLSFNIRFIPNEKVIEFNVIEGLNHTQSQGVNSWCVFSRDFENVFNEYYETNTDYPNVAYIYGENKSNGVPRVSTILDESGGGEKRELFVDAGDLRQTEGMSNSAYVQLLKQRGFEKLCEVGRFESVDFTVSDDTAMPFGLGDICTYKHMETGRIHELRITEINETHEKGKVKRNIVLGRVNIGVVEAIRKGAI